MRNFLTTILFVLLLGGCGSVGSTTINSTETGRTQYYRFEASITQDTTHQCQNVQVRVREQARLYSNRYEIPGRFRISDQDCQVPLTWERATFRRDREGRETTIRGPRILKFKQSHQRLFFELGNFMHEEVLPYNRKRTQE